jgi:hypothetical protein
LLHLRRDGIAIAVLVAVAAELAGTRDAHVGDGDVDHLAGRDVRQTKPELG